MYNSKSMIAEEFIDNEEILSTLEYAKNNKSIRNRSSLKKKKHVYLIELSVDYCSNSPR